LPSKPLDHLHHQIANTTIKEEEVMVEDVAAKGDKGLEVSIDLIEEVKAMVESTVEKSS